MVNKLSVIVPFLNEEENIEPLHKEILSVLKGIKIPSEIIYVNDGSRDKSMDVLKKVISDNKTSNITVKTIEFRHNFGQTAALAAGIAKCEGTLVSFLDADLQNDPKDLPRFLEKLDEGYDAIFGWRKDRKDATARSFLSRLANHLINWTFSYPFHDVGCSARVVKREYLEGLELYGELHRVMPVLIYLKGAKIGEIVVQHHSRKAGKSKYGFNRIVKTLIDIITVKFLSSYGTRPAYVFGSFGLGSLALSVLSVLIVAYKKLFLGVYVYRDPLFIIAVFFGLLGMQFIMMGLLAELQVRTYFESQNKPIYDIKSYLEY
jgi:glycosyltransferase involved in cell wall biosynthesis